MEKNNRSKSVAAVVIKDGCVLLARHSYGIRKGSLIVPGGYVEEGEMPEEAAARELLEETGIKAKITQLIGIRFNTKDWYAVFSAEYLDGEAHSDNNENTQVLWLPLEEVAAHEDIPDLTKKLIECALKEKRLCKIDYIGKNPPYSFYG